MYFTQTAKKIAPLLIERNETICVAESTTGGLISANLLSVPGASAYFEGGSVVYTMASRKAFLTLNRDRLKGLEPLTEAMAIAFAEAAREGLETTWGIAELGAAGPEGSPYGHPAGTSVIGISGPETYSTTIVTGSKDRSENMITFTEDALKLLEASLST